MKIAFCLHHFLPGYIGGTEIYILNLAKQLIKAHNDVVVIIPNPGIEITEEYYYEEIRIIKYAENSTEDRGMILGNTKPEGLGKFAEILVKENPSLVHFHELAPGRGPCRFHVEKVKELLIPIVITFHVPFYTCFKGTLIYKATEKCDGEIKIDKCTACIYHYKNITGFKATLLNTLATNLFKANINATFLNNPVGTAIGFPFVVNKIKNDLLYYAASAEKIIVIAEWYKQVLRLNKVPAEKIVFIQQGLSTGSFNKPAAIDVSLPIRVVYIGRITPLKGLHLLIDAILQLPVEKICLSIYGLETEDDYVVSLKNKTRAIENITWHGRISPATVVPALSSYHLLCLPSAFEMSPLVIQEAFAAGIPVIASDVNGNAEQIKDGINGWLFSTNDSGNLKDKLSALVNNTSLIDSAKKQLPILNTFEEVGNAHQTLYGGILKDF